MKINMSDTIESIDVLTEQYEIANISITTETIRNDIMNKIDCSDYSLYKFAKYLDNMLRFEFICDILKNAKYNKGRNLLMDLLPYIDNSKYIHLCQAFIRKKITLNKDDAGLDLYSLALYKLYPMETINKLPFELQNKANLFPIIVRRYNKGLTDSIHLLVYVSNFDLIFNFLQYLIMKNDHKNFKFLFNLNTDAFLKHADENGNTLLLFSKYLNNQEIITEILKHNPDINRKNKAGVCYKDNISLNSNEFVTYLNLEIGRKQLSKMITFSKTDVNRRILFVIIIYVLLSLLTLFVYH